MSEDEVRHHQTEKFSIESLALDLRYAVRTLIKRPGLNLVAILTLAFGIGANSAIFSFVKAALLDSLPYHEPDQLVMVWQDYSQRGGPLREWFSYKTFRDYQAQSSTLDDIGVFDDAQFIVRGEGDPEAVTGEFISKSLFDVLGVRFAHGRNFTIDEETSGDAAILGYEFWQRRYQGDPSLVGSKITIDDKPLTVVGILPESFYFPLVPAAQLFVPYKSIRPPSEDRGVLILRAVGRLKPGVTLEQARAELGTLAGRLAEEYPRYNADVGSAVFPLRDEIMGNVAPALIVLLAAAGFVLLIACANVANLLLARAFYRRGEIAARIAMGANRRRLINQFLAESFVLALQGGVLAVLLAVVGVEFLKRLAVSIAFPLPHIDTVTVSAPVFAFTLALAILTGFLFGLAPVLEIGRTNLSQTLLEDSSVSGRSTRSRTGRWLVVAEIALAVMLLIGANLMVRSFQQLRQVDTGYEAEGLLAFRLQTPPTRYPEAHQVRNFYQELITRLHALPGADSAAGVSALPLAENVTDARFTIEGRPDPLPGEEQTIWYRSITPEYFKTAQLAMLRGRGVEERDADGLPYVTVINESLAQRYFSDEDPIGQILNVGRTPFNIIGVVENVRSFGLDSEEPPSVYFAHHQIPNRIMGLVVRTDGDPSQLGNAVRKILLELDPAIAPINLMPLEEMVDDSVATERALGILVGAFSALALGLAVVGLYGLMTYLVGQRTREIGIRMALGAKGSSVLGLVLNHALRLALIGLAIGLGAALLLTRLLSSVLFEIDALDPMAFAGSAVILVLAVLLASYLPARRASRLPPAAVLRN